MPVSVTDLLPPCCACAVASELICDSIKRPNTRPTDNVILRFMVSFRLFVSVVDLKFLHLHAAYWLVVVPVAGGGFLTGSGRGLGIRILNFLSLAERFMAFYERFSTPLLFVSLTG